MARLTIWAWLLRSRLSTPALELVTWLRSQRSTVVLAAADTMGKVGAVGAGEEVDMEVEEQGEARVGVDIGNCTLISSSSSSSRQKG